MSDVSGMLHKCATECYITAHWAVNSYTNIKNRAELRLFVKGGDAIQALPLGEIQSEAAYSLLYT